ncbi:MAG: hypothetical protein AB1782_04420 [Cyanobacteriota bacterium]
MIYKKSNGQEAIEFALICGLVLIGSLVVILAFGKQIANFFNQAPTATEKVVAEIPLNDSTKKIDPDDILPGGDVIKIPNGSGGYYEISLTDPNFYITTETAGSSGTEEYVNNMSLYTQTLADALEDLGNQMGNANLIALANAIGNTASLEGGFVNYDTDVAGNPFTNLDPHSSTFALDFLNNIVGMDKTLKQIQDETCLAASPGFSCDAWENDVTGFTDGKMQENFALAIQQELAKVMIDTELPSAVKLIANLLTNQVQTLADNNSYTMDGDSFNACQLVFNDILSSIEKDVTDGTVLSKVQAESLMVEIGTAPAEDSAETEKAEYFVNLALKIKEYGGEDYLSKLSEEQRTILNIAASTLQVDINQPLSGVVDTTIAAQATCMAGGGSWDSSSKTCSAG